MTARIEIAAGIYVDARTVPIALLALFEGWPTAVVAATMPAAYRVWLGGSGAWAGVLSLGAAAAAGGLAHAWARRDGGVGPRHALTLSVVVFLTTFVSFALLGARGLDLFGQVWSRSLPSSSSASGSSRGSSTTSWSAPRPPTPTRASGASSTRPPTRSASSTPTRSRSST